MMKIDEKELNELFIQLKGNNKVAFEKLYNNYNKLVYGIAFSILKNKQDAEDIVQTVFAKIYAIDNNKLPNKNEASWIYSITKNESINLLRKRKDNVELEKIYEIEDSIDEINKIIDIDNYNRLISKLNDKEKEIISLKILANLSFEEIGKLLNEPVGTIKWRYYKSIKTLKILLSNLGMFIITFVIGIKTLANKKKSHIVEQETVKDENKTENNSTIREESVIQEVEKSESDKSYKNYIEDNLGKNEITEEKEEIIQDMEENIDYVGVGILSVSAIFLVITIFFSIIFTKYQLKIKKKMSK